MKNTSFTQATMMGFGRSNLQAYCHHMDIPGLGIRQVMSYSDFLSLSPRTVSEKLKIFLDKFTIEPFDSNGWRFMVEY